MSGVISYLCPVCKQDVEAESAMPHAAREHHAPQSAEDVAAKIQPVLCRGVGLPTKKNIDHEAFHDRVQQVF